MSRPISGIVAAVFCACAVGATFSVPVQAVKTEGDVRPQDAPVPLAEAATRMTVPDGFEVALFAGEPDVRQPIAFTTDDRGRLWVVECYSYPNWMPGAVRGQDRVVVFDDQDGDGRFDRRTMFWDKGDNLTGIELGFGGVWLCATPNLIFIPDRNADDRPDGEPVVVLDGWDPNCRHNAFNALRWGPDGWLYGCNGILSNSKIGRPGMPAADRVAINCGVWRLHPTTKIFEAVAHGTTNPWGLDFDDTGEMFITNCVIPHLFHVVPGAHFQRMYGEDINPHSYELMKSCSDHLHWGGGDWTSSRGGKGIHSEAGGGHAHAGAMIYLGDNWPDRYRNSVFICNIHGNRVNHDRLERSGSGYVARHEKDFLFANDEWFRGLEMKYGPDGGVFITDWSDIGECHDYDSADGVHRENGRIYKITYGQPRAARVDLATLGDSELIKLQLHKNDWYVRHARRLLQERAAAGQDMSQVHASLRQMFATNADESRKLRALWALHVTGGLTDEALARELDHESESVRSWAVRLLCDGNRPLPAGAGNDVFGRFVALATGDDSPRVRLSLASALGRIPAAQRWPIAAALASHAEDSGDPALPQMIWYGVEPLVSLGRDSAIDLAGRAKLSLVRRFLTRRAVLAAETAGERLDDRSSTIAAALLTIGTANDPAIRLDILSGIQDALRGRKNVAVPSVWPPLYARLARAGETGDDIRLVRERAAELALIFRDAGAIKSLTGTMMNGSASAAERRHAIRILSENGVAGLAPQLQQLVGDAAVRGAALRALAAYHDERTPAAIVQRFADFTPAERDDAVGTLSSRPAYAVALLDAVEKGTIPSRDISPFAARQVQALGNDRINERLSKVWGTVRPASQQRAEMMAKYKAALGADELKGAKPSAGRAIFDRTCGQCHKLFGSGGDVGPDLTGSNRTKLDYILENVLDPSAVVAREYRLTTVATTTGRLVSGIIRERSDKHLVIQTANDRVVLASDDIEEMKESPVSMMPEGIFDQLSAEEVRDLVGYLATPSQVSGSPSRARSEERAK